MRTFFVYKIIVNVAIVQMQIDGEFTKDIFSSSTCTRDKSRQSEGKGRDFEFRLIIMQRETGQNVLVG